MGQMRQSPHDQGAAQLFRYLSATGPRYNSHNKCVYMPVLRACLRMLVHACMCAV